MINADYWSNLVVWNYIEFEDWFCVWLKLKRRRILDWCISLVRFHYWKSELDRMGRNKIANSLFTSTRSQLSWSQFKDPYGRVWSRTKFPKARPHVSHVTNKARCRIIISRIRHIDIDVNDSDIDTNDYLSNKSQTLLWWSAEITEPKLINKPFLDSVNSSSNSKCCFRFDRLINFSWSHSLLFQSYFFYWISIFTWLDVWSQTLVRFEFLHWIHCWFSVNEIIQLFIDENGNQKVDANEFTSCATIYCIVLIQ